MLSSGLLNCSASRMGRAELLSWFLLYAVTFGVILPLLCRNLRYSYYYQGGGGGGGEDRSEMIHSVDQLEWSKQEHLGQRNGSEKSTFLIISVVTVKRSGHYLTRVMWKLQQIARLWQGAGAIRVLMCNVDINPDEHQEAVALSRWFPMIARRSDHKAPNAFEKEKQDYVFCLNASRHADAASDYVLLLEDDALPEDDLLSMILHLTGQRFREANDLGTDFYYLKLYHPERIQGYLHPEPSRIFEWLTVCAAAGSILALGCSSLYRPSRKSIASRANVTTSRCIGWALYLMLLIETVGRHHLLELRRISPHLYSVSPTSSVNIFSDQ